MTETCRRNATFVVQDMFIHVCAFVGFVAISKLGNVRIILTIMACPPLSVTLSQDPLRLNEDSDRMEA